MRAIHFGFMEINDQIDFLYLGCFVALHDVITIDIAFFNHLCLCCGDHDGSFKTCIKFMHINNIPSFMENNPHAYTSHFTKKPMTYNWCMGPFF